MVRRVSLVLRVPTGGAVIDVFELCSGIVCADTPPPNSESTIATAIAYFDMV
jgi:hypothetical protein